jgi:hypothetical protein
MRTLMMMMTMKTMTMKREMILVVKNLQNLPLDPCLLSVILSLHLDTPLERVVRVQVTEGLHLESPLECPRVLLYLEVHMLTAIACHRLMETGV